MAKKFGIEAVKKAVKFGLKLGGDVVSALEDGKLSLDEYPVLLGDLMGAGEVIKSGKDLVNEFGDLDADETVELNNFIDENFDLADDVREAQIEKALHAAAALYDLYLSFKPKEVEGE